MKIFIVTFFLLVGTAANAQENNDFSNCEWETINGREIIKVAEIAPQYDGGFSKFYKDISSKFKISKSTDEGCVKVMLSFVVDADDEIKNICSNGKIDISEELIASINHWKAGKLDEEKVPVRMYIPIFIKLG